MERWLRIRILTSIEDKEAMIRWILFALVALLVLVLAGCTVTKGQIMDGDGMVRTFEYTQISQDEAKEMMALDDGHVIVDVRRAVFATG